MVYRDPEAAARAHLAALEHELAERRVSRAVLTRYRDALRDEWSRLSHALVWYQNGERYGWNHFRTRDDLTPAAPASVGLPSVAQIADTLTATDGEELAQRAALVQRALALVDPSLIRVRIEVE